MRVESELKRVDLTEPQKAWTAYYQDARRVEIHHAIEAWFKRWANR